MTERVHDKYSPQPCHFASRASFAYTSNTRRHLNRNRNGMQTSFVGTIGKNCRSTSSRVFIRPLRSTLIIRRERIGILKCLQENSAQSWKRKKFSSQKILLQKKEELPEKPHFYLCGQEISYNQISIPKKDESAEFTDLTYSFFNSLTPSEHKYPIRSRKTAPLHPII